MNFMKKDMIDDKELVIFCVAAIAICAMFQMSEPATIVSSCISGLLGVAVGKGQGIKLLRGPKGSDAGKK